MEDDQRTSRSNNNNISSYEELDYQSVFNPIRLTYASILNSFRPSTPIVRHNFKSIDELLSPTVVSRKNDDTGYNSQLSASFQSQENDDNIENEKPTKSSTPIKKKVRTAFTDDQKQYLERFYSTNRYPDPTEMEALSSFLSLQEKVIRVWFQNKRSREKHVH